MPTLALRSVLRCPVCGHAESLPMPTDACLFFHGCAGCHALLRPAAGDCCVFCSYGSVPCPPVQATGRCGDSGCGAAEPPVAAGGAGAPPRAGDR